MKADDVNIWYWHYILCLCVCPGISLCLCLSVFSFLYSCYKNKQTSEREPQWPICLLKRLTWTLWIWVCLWFSLFVSYYCSRLVNLCKCAYFAAHSLLNELLARLELRFVGQSFSTTNFENISCGDIFFLACEDFWGRLDKLFPACAFFKVESSSETIISTL